MPFNNLFSVEDKLPVILIFVFDVYVSWLHYLSSLHEATPGVRKEPQWRQELRMRQEQMQGGGQSSSSSHHPEAELSVQTSQPVVISKYCYCFMNLV